MVRTKWLSVVLVVMAITLGVALFVRARSTRFDPNDPDRAGVIRRTMARDQNEGRKASLASLNHEDPDVRAVALASLGIVRNPADLPLIETVALNDTSPAVRSQACRTLVRYDTPESVNTVCELATNAESSQVRHGALKALAATEQPIARVTQVIAMDYALTDGDRQAAAEGLWRNLGMPIPPNIDDPKAWTEFLESVKHAARVENAFDELDKPLVNDDAVWDEMRRRHAAGAAESWPGRYGTGEDAPAPHAHHEE